MYAVPKSRSSAAQLDAIRSKATRSSFKHRARPAAEAAEERTEPAERRARVAAAVDVVVEQPDAGAPRGQRRRAGQVGERRA